jgi:hypothetical protein
LGFAEVDKENCRYFDEDSVKGSDVEHFVDDVDVDKEAAISAEGKRKQVNL